jgi:ribosomal protein S10
MYLIHLHVKSFTQESIVELENFLFPLFSFLDVNSVRQKVKPKKIKKITVLRSPHIDKKSREQYQMKHRKKIYSVSMANKNIVFLFLEILKDINLIGVELEILIEFSNYKQKQNN